MSIARHKLGLLVWLICPGLVLCCPGCKRQAEGPGTADEFEIERSFEKGPLKVHVRLDKDKLTIAQTLLLEFETAIEPGYKVQMPKVDKVLENFGILDWDNLGSKLGENDNVVTRYRYRLEPFLSGKYEIPAFTFEFHDVNEPQDKSYELTTEPIDVEVTSLLDEDRAELTIEDIEGVVEMPQKASVWWVWVLGAALLAATVAIVLTLRRRRSAKLVRVFKPAHEIAYARLRALVKDDLLGAGRVKEFYERLSGILRHYIEHRFELRAPERTTEEFLAELKHSDLLGEADKQMLAEFLTHCDLVKFAEHQPSNEQIQRSFDLAKEFIEKTKSDERTIDVTEHVQAAPQPESEVA